MEYNCATVPQLSLDFLELFKQNRILRLVADRMDIDISDDPFLIDDEDGTFRKSLCPKDTILQSCQAVRPKVAEQWVGNTPQRLCPCFDCGNRVDT